MMADGRLAIPAFKAKVVEAVEMLPSMTFREKCEAVQFYSNVLEKLQSILHKATVDMGSLASELKREHVSCTHNEVIMISQPARNDPEGDEDMSSIYGEEAASAQSKDEAMVSSDSTVSSTTMQSQQPLPFSSGSAIIIVPAMTNKQLHNVVQLISSDTTVCKSLIDNEPMETSDDMKGVGLPQNPLDTSETEEKLIHQDAISQNRVALDDANMEANSEINEDILKNEKQRLRSTSEKTATKKKFIKTYLPFLVRKRYNSNSITCPKCSCSFISRSHLKVHLRSHHEQESFGCPLCKLKFAPGSDTKQHLCTHGKATG